MGSMTPCRNRKGAATSANLLERRMLIPSPRLVSLSSLAAALAIGLTGCPKDDAKDAPAPAPTPAADAHGGHGDHAAVPGTPTPTDAKSVHFVWPQDGSKVFANVDVAFGVTGMKLRKAGEDPLDKTTGHHHIIIDGAAIATGQVVPKDATHIHYGDAQTVAALTLPTGDHTLTMQLADGAHLSYGPDLATTIKLSVVEAPAKRGVAFVGVKDGDTIASPAKLTFGVEGFTIRPAGEDVLDKTSGHHHLIIDGDCSPLGAVVGKDDTHIHYGKGETSAEIPLAAGPHTLTLQLADGAHMSYGPSVCTTIKVTVK